MEPRAESPEEHRGCSFCGRSKATSKRVTRKCQCELYRFGSEARTQNKQLSESSLWLCQQVVPRPICALSRSPVQNAPSARIRRCGLPDHARSQSRTSAAQTRGKLPTLEELALVAGARVARKGGRPHSCRTRAEGTWHKAVTLSSSHCMLTPHLKASTVRLF